VPHPKAQPSKSERQRFVDHVHSTPISVVFQPVIDVATMQPIGHECLSRFGGYESPSDFFAEARSYDAVWELDARCRDAVLTGLANLPERQRNGTFFINLAPTTLQDPRLQESLSLRRRRKYGLQDATLVLEVTESDAVPDHQGFESAVQHYVEHGFHIALDDLGAGHSGLLTMISAAPAFLKLDRNIARGVHKHVYKQALVKALVTFARSVDASVICEGVEEAEELEVLVRLGARYIQGYLLAEPGEQPGTVTDEVAMRFRRVGRSWHDAGADLDDTIASLVVRRHTVQRQQLTTEDADRLFRHDPNLDHFVILDGDEPQGLVTRTHLYIKTGGPFGYPLFQRRPIDRLAKRNALVVAPDTRITRIAQLAMDRMPADLYDPIIVVDDRQRFLGTVTMKQIIARSAELEIETASGLNPLTQLPGNRVIQKWIRDAISTPPYAVIYADLDRFKEYNDTFGFYMGDEMIRLAARVLARNLRGLHPAARLGHIGGDDFVVVAPGVDAMALNGLCAEFDREKLTLFDRTTAHRGTYVATDRTGRSSDVNLTTLSLAVIECDRVDSDIHPAALSQMATSLKKKVKSVAAVEGCSTVLFERRRLVAAH